MDPSDFAQVVVTAADTTEAERIARTLLERRLAASVQIAPCHSLYRWKGRIEEAQEQRCNIKTRQALFPELARVVRALHSYETPEIFAMPITAATPEYLTWLDEEITQGGNNDGKV